MDWAEDKAPPELQQFDFVFLITLRDVDSDIPIEELVIKQHKRMKVKRIPPEKVKSILEGTVKCKVLMMLDGYDEYQKSTNTHINDAISDTIGDCFIIITSRPGDYMSKDDQDQMDGEIQIVGLSEASIQECASKYLQSEDRASDLLHQTKEAKISELLCIPIVLLMVCILYHEHQSLPSSKTDIVWKIITMCMDRSTLKHLGKKSSEIADLDELLDILGQLSLESLQRDTKKLLIQKVRIKKSLVKEKLNTRLWLNVQKVQNTKESVNILFLHCLLCFLNHYIVFVFKVMRCTIINKISVSKH